MDKAAFTEYLCHQCGYDRNRPGNLPADRRKKKNILLQVKLMLILQKERERSVSEEDNR